MLFACGHSKLDFVSIKTNEPMVATPKQTVLKGSAGIFTRFDKTENSAKPIAPSKTHANTIGFGTDRAVISPLLMTKSTQANPQTITKTWCQPIRCLVTISENIIIHAGQVYCTESTSTLEPKE